MNIDETCGQCTGTFHVAADTTAARAAVTDWRDTHHCHASRDVALDTLVENRADIAPKDVTAGFRACVAAT